MSQGQSKSDEVSAVQGFGPHRKNMLVQIDRRRVPDRLDPQVGQQIPLHVRQGQQIQAVVLEVTDESLTLDANHPLAGRDLKFELEVVEIA
jgi:FKBP-type peptidyl-prolyl cis-trans isomerase 2